LNLQITSVSTSKDRATKKCRIPFARNSPFGCFAQKVPDTYLSLIAKSVIILASCNVSATEDEKATRDVLAIKTVLAVIASRPADQPFSVVVELFFDRNRSVVESISPDEITPKFWYRRQGLQDCRWSTTRSFRLMAANCIFTMQTGMVSHGVN